MRTSFSHFNASRFLVCGAALMLGAVVAQAAPLNPIFLNGTVEGYGNGKGGYQFICEMEVGAECRASGASFPFFGIYYGYEYWGTVNGVARGSITPGALYASTEVVGYGTANCVLPVCENAPKFGGIGYAVLDGDLYVDAPTDGIVTFLLQNDEQSPVRMNFPVTQGRQFIMRINLSAFMVFVINSEPYREQSFGHSLRITDVQIVPEPATAPLVFGGLVLTAAMVRLRKRCVEKN